MKIALLIKNVINKTLDKYKVRNKYEFINYPAKKTYPLKHNISRIRFKGEKGGVYNRLTDKGPQKCKDELTATPVANFSTIFPSVVDTGGKFATGVNDTGGKFATGVNDAGGKLPPVSATPAANLPPVSTTPVANNGNNIRLQIP